MKTVPVKTPPVIYYGRNTDAMKIKDSIEDWMESTQWNENPETQWIGGRKCFRNSRKCFRNSHNSRNSRNGFRNSTIPEKKWDKKKALSDTQNTNNLVRDSATKYNFFLPRESKETHTPQWRPSRINP